MASNRKRIVFIERSNHYDYYFENGEKYKTSGAINKSDILGMIEVYASFGFKPVIKKIK